MTLDEVNAVLSEQREALRQMGVVSLRVFGSVARGEAGPQSDVDFLIELDPARSIDLLDVAHIKGELEDMLGCGVDLVEAAALNDRMRSIVLKEAVVAG